MTNRTRQDTAELLDALAAMGSHGQAEGESSDHLPKTWMPIREHLRAFDPDVVIVVGPRGAGKTEMFKAVFEHHLLDAAASRWRDLRLPPSGAEKTTWLPAYPVRSEFPDDTVLARFFKDKKPNDEALVGLWNTFLLRRLVMAGILAPSEDLRPVIEPPSSDIGAVLDSFERATAGALGALDRLDEELLRQDRGLFVAYDELETIGGADSLIVQRCVQGLVGFWARRSRRWRRIRAKIFLRTDLYERAGTLGGADFAKLAANRVELTWSDRNLYAMLVKRIANTNDRLLEYCKTPVRFETQADPDLGWFPATLASGEAEALIERMVGEYMGKTARKGFSHRWILNHVRDGRGHALPRPLVRLIEKSASLQRESNDFPRWPRLLEPMYLRRAINTASDEHVVQSKNEWPWLERLKKILETEPEVPWDRRQIERILRTMSDAPTPAYTPREWVEYLVEVGIFRRRQEDRIDTPDLYLHGLGLRRRGGVTLG